MIATASTLTAGTFATVLGANGRDIIRVGLVYKVLDQDAKTITVQWAGGDRITYAADRKVRVS